MRSSASRAPGEAAREANSRYLLADVSSASIAKRSMLSTSRRAHQPAFKENVVRRGGQRDAPLLRKVVPAAQCAELCQMLLLIGEHQRQMVIERFILTAQLLHEGEGAGIQLYGGGFHFTCHEKGLLRGGHLHSFVHSFRAAWRDGIQAF